VARAARSRVVGALVATGLIVAFYAYGPINDAMVRLLVETEGEGLSGWLARTLVRHAVLTPILFVTCVSLAWVVARRVRANPARLTNACNVAAAALAIMLLIRLGTVLWNDRALVTAPHGPEIAGRQVSVLGYNPDIYYIILDGYARADILEQIYGFDNAPFIGDLERRGFVVSALSQTNYFWTFLSLASSLNFDYLQDIAAPILADPKAIEERNGFGQVARLVQDNRAAHFLRARGYRFVHLRSSSPETVRNPYADEEVACSHRMFDDEYFRALAEASWAKTLESAASTDLAECHQLRLKALGDQAHRPGPKFVFAHFLPPHHPYLFDHAGNVLRHVTISNQWDFQARLWEDKAAYVEQLRYVNRTVIEVIDRIRAESARPPVIIVQSDHGPNLHDGLSFEEHVAVRLANFAAYFFPDAAAQPIPRDCAPVNQFRYLFNHYFDAGLPILPNRSFYSDFRTPLQMREVSFRPSRERS
jgi:hypothetical protein